MKTALIPGHRPGAPGAGMGGLHEFPVMHALAQEIKSQALLPGDCSLVVEYRPDEVSGLSLLIERLNNGGFDLGLSLHLNASKGDSPGVGYCIAEDLSGQTHGLAQSLNSHIAGGDRPERVGPHEDTRGLAIIQDTDFPVILDEPAYIDLWEQQRWVLSNLAGLANRYAGWIGMITKNRDAYGL